MDVAWIILDALSFEATPFAADGPDTMPELSALAEEHGVVFTEAYAPGTASPSSHASMFTGELPSRTGMHEASPYFDSDLPTVGDALADTHRSLMISYNPFIFNGLERGFDVTDDLRGSQYMVFDEATDPRKFLVANRDTPVPKRYVRFLREGGKPIRTFVNGVSFKLWDRRADNGRPEAIEAEAAQHQYATKMNREIRSFLDDTSGAGEDSFVVANYMDIHPPLGASDEALDRFAPGRSREELPIGERSPEIIERIEAGDETAGEDMETLYHAAIWDTDRKVGPLVREMVESGTHVIVTADHGSRFTGHSSLDDRRIHVPLLVFAPDADPRTVDHSVNIRSMAATTLAQVAPGRDTFDGYDLLEVTEDKVSITEFIHDSSPTGNSVSAFGDFETVQYDVTGIKGDTRVDWIDGGFRDLGDSETEQELATIIEDLQTEGLDTTARSPVEYDQDTQERLEDLGYL
jgi:arylsulfatase A-like enzyme